MMKKVIAIALFFAMLCALAACAQSGQQNEVRQGSDRIAVGNTDGAAPVAQTGEVPEGPEGPEDPGNTDAAPTESGDEDSAGTDLPDLPTETDVPVAYALEGFEQYVTLRGLMTDASPRLWFTLSWQGLTEGDLQMLRPSSMYLTEKGKLYCCDPLDEAGLPIYKEQYQKALWFYLGMTPEQAIAYVRPFCRTAVENRYLWKNDAGEHFNAPDGVIIDDKGNAFIRSDVTGKFVPYTGTLDLTGYHPEVFGPELLDYEVAVTASADENVPYGWETVRFQVSDEGSVSWQDNIDRLNSVGSWTVNGAHVIGWFSREQGFGIATVVPANVGPALDR